MMREKDPTLDLSSSAYAVLARAKACGTLNKLDRRAQYDRADEARPERLLRAVNELGNHLRLLKADKERLQHQLMNLKLRNSVIVAIVTAVVFRLVERFLR